MASIKAASESIQESWRLLLHQWQRTASLWSDAAQRQFQKSYMDEYEPAVIATLRELGRLEQVVAQARRSVK